MSNPSESQRIVLVGFMGSGKTTVGEKLAALLQARFIDLDAVIAEQAGMSIPDIFSREGEEGFRWRETRALESLRASEHAVIATGGGVVTVEENWPLMRRLGPVVFLRTQLRSALTRIGDGRGRPLAQGDDREERMASLLTERTPLYEKADYIVDTDGLSPLAVARLVREKLQAGSER